MAFKRRTTVSVTRKSNALNSEKMLLCSCFMDTESPAFRGQRQPATNHPPEVCLCLSNSQRDLSPSFPLCQDDTLSFQASRWPFVCDDLLIFLFSSSGFIPHFPTHSCCSPLIIACRDDGGTSSCSLLRCYKKKIRRKKNTGTHL